MRVGPIVLERRRAPVDQVSKGRYADLNEVLVENRFVDWTDDGSAMIVVPRGDNEVKQLRAKLPGTMGANNSQAPMSELGMTGTSIWFDMLREDYNPLLRGAEGLRKWDEMRRNDAQVRASLRLMKTPVLAARWFVQPASQSTQDKKIAEYIWDNLTKWMTISWTQVLIESLLCLDFGYYMFEKVFDYHPSGNRKMIWKKLAPRHPMDVMKWEYDANGGPAAAWFYDPMDAQGTRIPISKLLVMSFDKEANNVGGISVLRSAYKHWFIKEALYKIDAIQKERHGVGLPIIKLPPNFSDNDRKLANDMGRNLRTNEKAHLVLPPNWEIDFAEVKGQMTDAISSIQHHDNLIARNVLGQFLDASLSSTRDETQAMFLKATRFLAENIRDVYNKYAIPELVNYNWKNIEDYPELRVRRIGDAVDWRAVSFAVRNFIGSGVIVPDASLEEWVRDEMDLPGVDPDTARVQETPQLPEGIPGMPQIPTVDVPVSGITTLPKRTQKVTTPPNAAAAPGSPRQAKAARMRPAGSSLQGAGTNNSA